MKYYNCPNCSARLSFEALSCWNCETEVGYVLNNDGMMSMRDLPAAARCANRALLSCNWIIDPAITVSSALCPCCRYTRTIPPQQDSANRVAWKKLEQAKRLLLYSLNSLGLSPPDRVEQPSTGLAFDFLTQLPDQPSVLTAHNSGVITINISEADDARREQRRELLNEPYRTVLGHLRHEVGHFYWCQLIAHSDYLEQYRLHFGDERQDYDSALQSYYKNAETKVGWSSQFVTRYASSHPWEDWAETWAHYLNIHDALETAAAWYVSVRDISLAQQKNIFTSNNKFRQQLTSAWPQLCEYLNAVFRSTGVNGEYPPHLTDTVIAKLTFIHQVVAESTPVQKDVIVARSMP